MLSESPGCSISTLADLVSSQWRGDGHRFRSGGPCGRSQVLALQEQRLLQDHVTRGKSEEHQVSESFPCFLSDDRIIPHYNSDETTHIASLKKAHDYLGQFATEG